MKKKLRKTWKQLSKKKDLQRTLQESGFHVVNFEDHESMLSSLFVELGYTSGELSAESFSSYIHPDDVKTYNLLWDRVLQGAENVFSAEFRLKNRHTGEWCWVQSHGAVISRTPSGAVSVFAGMVQDITVRKESEVLLRKQLEDTQAIFHLTESLRVASMLANSNLDPKKTISLVLEQAHYIISFQRAAIFAWEKDKLEFLECLDFSQGEAPRYDTALESHASAVVLSRAPEIHDHLEDCGRYRSWMGIPLIFRQEFLGVLEFWHEEAGFFHSEQIWPAMSFGDSISESLFNAKKYDAVIKDSQTDPLTGLSSRRQLQLAGPALVEQSCREKRALSILLLDIDHFKAVNDNYGHIVGDAVLFAIAQLCRNLLRQEDLFFRFGGEEFVALLPETDEATAVMVAERLRESVAASEFRGFEKPVTVSIGVVSLGSEQTADYETLLHEADLAMYQAKNGGRNRVIVSPRWQKK